MVRCREIARTSTYRGFRIIEGNNTKVLSLPSSQMERYQLCYESNLYSTQKNPNSRINLTPINIKKYIGILLFSSVVKVTNFRDYWCPFLNATSVRECMSVNEFDRIRVIL